MSDFETKLLEIIDESETALTEIEYVLFTKRYNLSQKHFNIFTSQSITMIYSIWEGFVQRAFQLYISELNKEKIEFLNFSGEITIFHMESTFKQLIQYPQYDTGKINFYSQLDAFFSNKYQDLSPQVNTGSNVGFAALNRLLKIFCLKPFDNYWENYQHPKNLQQSLDAFLNHRNITAHAWNIIAYEKKHIPDVHKTYKEYQKLVLDLMYAIREKMMDGLKDKTYLKTKS
jgi:hypothetical protein